MSSAATASALPARDPERLAPSRLARAFIYFIAGAIGAAAGAILMAMDAGIEGHGHGGGGSPFAMLPHQVLLSLPLAILVVTLLRDATPARMAEALIAASAGLVAVDLLLA